VDKQVPNSMPEQGKQLLESFALVCRQKTEAAESMEPTSGIEPLTC
jgi:hypothetical protein